MSVEEHTFEERQEYIRNQFDEVHFAAMLAPLFALGAKEKEIAIACEISSHTVCRALKNLVDIFHNRMSVATYAALTFPDEIRSSLIYKRAILRETPSDDYFPDSDNARILLALIHGKTLSSLIKCYRSSMQQFFDSLGINTYLLAPKYAGRAAVTFAILSGVMNPTTAWSILIEKSEDILV